MSSLVVDLRAHDGRLDLHYQLTGDLRRLSVPAPAPAVRSDGLWRHTCFEAFVAMPGSDGYLEYNVSPSGAWAAYRFDGYRTGMAPLEQGAPPESGCLVTGQRLELRVAFDLGWLDADRRAAPGALRLGLTAVIEDAAGVLSYWALAHASEKPDFHRAESFVAAIS